MNVKLEQIRKRLKLSQKFVAKQLGMTRTMIADIEAGARKVTIEELERFSELYGVNTDELVYGKMDEKNKVITSVEAFYKLSNVDKKAIISLMHLKEVMKKRGLTVSGGSH